MKPCRILLARSAAAVTASGHAATSMAVSKSSITNHPPGRNAAAIRRNASARRGT